MLVGIDTYPYFTVRYDEIVKSFPTFTLKDWNAFVDYISNEMDEYLYQFDPDDVEDN